jgi:hypothetical protein
LRHSSTPCWSVRRSGLRCCGSPASGCESMAAARLPSHQRSESRAGVPLGSHRPPSAPPYGTPCASPLWRRFGVCGTAGWLGRRCSRRPMWRSPLSGTSAASSAPSGRGPRPTSRASLARAAAGSPQPLGSKQPASTSPPLRPSGVSTVSLPVWAARKGASLPCGCGCRRRHPVTSHNPTPPSSPYSTLDVSFSLRWLYPPAFAFVSSSCVCCMQSYPTSTAHALRKIPWTEGKLSFARNRGI